MKITGWGATDTGRKRSHNEDSYLVDNGSSLFAVADGMGGHRGGATASRMALEVLQQHVTSAIPNLGAAANAIEAESFMAFEATDVLNRDVLEHASEARARLQRASTLPGSMGGPGCEPTLESSLPAAVTVMRAAVEEASLEIYEVARGDSKLRGMGTTLTAMLYDSGRMHVVHAGDSRAYLFRNGELIQLTEDHSWIAEQVKSGIITVEEAKLSKYRHVITRSVGFERRVDVETYGVAVEAGDCFLLCSDGMSNLVEPGEIEKLMADTWFHQVPQGLIDLANNHGGDDNITVVVVHVANHAPDPAPDPAPDGS